MSADLDLVVRDLARLSSPEDELDTGRIAVSRKNGEIGAVGKPDAQPDAPTVPFGSFLGQSPSPHGRPSPSSSTPRHSDPPATNDHPGLGATRSREFKGQHTQFWTSPSGVQSVSGVQGCNPCQFVFPRGSGRARD